ncbi:hypothetical protein E4U41_001371 [Claviceps citrina]|nr:hypothetical protein E4U41_001371 [Claviceps citrina]
MGRAWLGLQIWKQPLSKGRDTAQKPTLVGQLATSSAQGSSQRAFMARWDWRSVLVEQSTSGEGLARWRPGQDDVSRLDFIWSGVVGCGLAASPDQNESRETRQGELAPATDSGREQGADDGAALAPPTKEMYRVGLKQTAGG